jgi:hypothetical protein
MTHQDVAHVRLVNQLLINGKAKTPDEVVSHLGCVQAQDYAGGELSIGLRLYNSTLADVEHSIANRKVVRTWAMRGTLHFVAAADTRWILELLAPDIIAGIARRYRELELDDATLTKSNSVLARTLRDGKQMTRSELAAELEKNGISCEGQRAAHILQRASLDRIICFGVTHTKQTHVLFEEWLPRAKSMPREESLAELTRRYFASHGPATIQDYMWWSGLKASDAKAGLDMTKSEFEQSTVNGQPYWMPSKNSSGKAAGPVACLLPAFDEFILGYKDRSASVSPDLSAHLRTGGIPDQIIVIEGKVVGTWRRALKKNNVVLKITLSTRLKKKEKAGLDMAIERYGEFVRRVPIVTFA